ncbi:MAG: hypothetical protein RBR69_05065 [Candidatus Cloacimonadaceae bacterium]|jgi:hypothetical protein|nr:hypothetical protein [Candidatus Cloacimonadota bacterium]MDY0127480.1 hypothetical protein [Candidatus Cloacimonadaceae bacterium]MCB5254557.1 hypothetical protein [Candidatus Cloacimonadota bacterium]MCK9178516.1 hypothetical protein [Candidatus Cloacimonadota bacterium]MCK9241862.1 hypothetical protein [Candidatus Cloacimonadota bacterium]
MIYEDDQYPDYSSCEDHDLKVLFEQAETDSEAYNAIMEELTQRGYDFEPESAPMAPLSQIDKKCSKMRWWNLIAIIISTALAIFYLRIHENFYQVQASTVIMIYGALALIISMIYLGSGVRTITALRDSKFLVPIVPALEYWFFTILWFLVAAYELYSSVRALIYFLQNEAGLAFSLYGILPSLAMGAFALFMALAFLYIALDLQSAKRVNHE